MKSLGKAFIITILLLVFSINGIAANDTETMIDYADCNVTVVFDSSIPVSSDVQQRIAEYLVYGTVSASESSVQPRAFCWLTGHDYVTSTVSTIEHEVYATAPRCVESLYEVTTCSKCDYMESTCLSSISIYCCP